MMTDETLDTLDRLERRATRMPWWVERVSQDVDVLRPFIPKWIVESSNRNQAEADFAFIVALRNHARELLDAAAELRAMKQAVGEFTSYDDASDAVTAIILARRDELLKRKP